MEDESSLSGDESLSGGSDAFSGAFLHGSREESLLASHARIVDDLLHDHWRVQHAEGVGCGGAGGSSVTILQIFSMSPHSTESCCLFCIDTRVSACLPLSVCSALALLRPPLFMEWAFPGGDDELHAQCRHREAVISPCCCCCPILDSLYVVRLVATIPCTQTASSRICESRTRKTIWRAAM